MNIDVQATIFDTGFRIECLGQDEPSDPAIQSIYSPLYLCTMKNEAEDPKEDVNDQVNFQKDGPEEPEGSDPENDPFVFPDPDED